jgi:hypothetical protein
MAEQGIDRLIALLSADQSGKIDTVTRAGNSEDTISITFADGEVLVLTAETNAAENLESTNVAK